MVYLEQFRFPDAEVEVAKGNPQSEAFWQKNGFVRTGKEVQNDGYIAVCMKREL